MIKIIDYGMGNLRSVQKAFENQQVEAEICDRAADLRDADKLVLPGVGAFRDAIGELHRQDFVGPIGDHIAAGRPLLGICLGLQLLFNVSYEDGEYEGLGIVPGEVVRFDSQPGLTIPHIGWNALEFTRPSPLTAGLEEGDHVYFVHSYHVVPEDESVILARTGHGSQFVSIIERENLFATQFHPEKSQSVGLRILANFASLPVNVAM